MVDLKEEGDIENDACKNIEKLQTMPFEQKMIVLMLLVRNLNFKKGDESEGLTEFY